MAEGINDRSSSCMKQFTELDVLMIANPDAVGSIIVVGERYTDSWMPHFATGKGYIIAANASTAGITDDKNGAKSTASTSGSTQAGLGKSYAISVGNGGLKIKMNKLTYNKLNKVTNDPDLEGVVQDIFDTLMERVDADPTHTPDYFTALTLAPMMLDKVAYAGQLGLYKIADNAKNLGKRNFEDISIVAMEEDIEFIEGFLNTIDLVYPDFVQAFRLILKKLNTLGKRYQGVQANLFNGSLDEVFGLGGLMAVIGYPVTKKGKIDKTNSMGVVPMMNLKVGKWVIKFSCPGYVTQNITVIVKAKRKVILNVVMVPIAPPVSV